MAKMAFLAPTKRGQELHCISFRSFAARGERGRIQQQHRHEGCGPRSLFLGSVGDLLARYLGMQPEVATGETTSFPSICSALTEDAPHAQGVWS